MELPSQPQVTVQPGVAGKHVSGEGMFTHAYHDETGKQLGIARVIPRNDGNTLHVEYIGPHDAKPGDAAMSGATGTGHIRQVFRGLAAQYPKAQYVSGLRAGGATPGRLLAAIPGRGGQPGRLARNGDRDALIRSIQESKGDKTPSGAFADHLDETNTPGQHIVRGGDVGLQQAYFGPEGSREQWGTLWHSNNILHRHLPSNAEAVTILRSDLDTDRVRRPAVRVVVGHRADPDGQDAGNAAWHGKTAYSLKELHSYIKDFPLDHQKLMLTAAARHFRRLGPERLARDSNRDPLIGSINNPAPENLGDATPSLAFADHLNETSTPGEHVVRAAAYDRGAKALSHIGNHIAQGGDAEWNWSAHPAMKDGKGTYALRVTHTPSTTSKSGVTHTAEVTSLKHAYDMTADFPKTDRKNLLTAIRDHVDRAGAVREGGPRLVQHLRMTGQPGRHIVRAAHASGDPLMMHTGDDTVPGINHPLETHGNLDAARSTSWRVRPTVNGHAQLTVYHRQPSPDGNIENDAFNIHRIQIQHGQDRMLHHMVSDFPENHREQIVDAVHAIVGPQRLARVTPEQRRGLGNAVGTLNTDNHAGREDIAKQVMREAGLRASVRPAIAATGADTRPAHVIAVHGATSPEHVAYAAAWYGLLSGERGLRVFHPGDGNDTLHVIEAPIPADHAVSYMQKAGIPSFSVERQGNGSRIFAQHNGDLSHLARGLNARHTTIAGSVSRLGSGESTGAGADAGSAARADYRSTIRAAEASTGPLN